MPLGGSCLQRSSTSRSSACGEATSVLHTCGICSRVTSACPRRAANSPWCPQSIVQSMAAADTPWLRENSDAHGGRRHAWWLQSRTCRPAEQDRTSCLVKEMLHCRHVGSLGSRRNCGEVCTTLSMVNALQRFVSRNSTQRMLILEDDVCPTVALGSMRLLAELATRPWSLAKLGHCYGGDLSEGSCDATSKASQQAVRRSRPTFRDGLGSSFCAHALGVDRMAARRLIALAFPVPMVWDDLLRLLSGQWREAASSLDAGLRRIGLRSATALGAVHTSHSLFAQLSRGSNASFNSTIRGSGATARSAGEAAGDSMRFRKRAQQKVQSLPLKS